VLFCCRRRRNCSAATPTASPAAFRFDEFTFLGMSVGGQAGSVDTPPPPVMKAILVESRSIENAVCLV
jgi:hypothetical protein